MTIADHPVRTAETEIRDELALVRADLAELLAHARATVAAHRDGDLDPIAILAGLLEERGQLPAPGQHPAELLAQAWAGGEQR